MHSIATTSDLRLSKHAAIRAKQRGISLAVIDLLLRHADAEIKVGNGSRSIWLTHTEAARLREDGLSPSLVERAQDVALVVAADGSIVTVTHLFSRRQRQYRRGFVCKTHRGSPRPRYVR